MAVQRLTTQELERLLEHESNIKETFSTLPDSPLLRLLASLDRTLLAQFMDEQVCEPGEIICREGDSGSAMYLIRSGRVLVVKGSLQSPTILGHRGPGEIIGEMALLEDQPRSATNIALENVRLLRIERENFQRWVNTNPAVGISVMATLSARLRDSDNVRTSVVQGGQQLVKQVTRLQSEKEHLLELQRVRQETSDLIVHDLRNPLGVIYGALNMFEMVLPEDVLQENRDLLDLANTACERMQRLVDSLLDVAKLETGEMMLNLSSRYLKPLLVDAAHRERLASKTRNINIRLAIQDNLPPVPVDAEKIDRVLANLLDNAIKYTPDNAEIVLVAEELDNAVVVSVIDAGSGIAAEERERIFERFAQAPGGKPTRRGFGLGLTFCRLTVEAHGGRIWVEPGPSGIGSRFCFTLPFLSF